MQSKQKWSLLPDRALQRILHFRNLHVSHSLTSLYSFALVCNSFRRAASAVAAELALPISRYHLVRPALFLGIGIVSVPGRDADAQAILKELAKRRDVVTALDLGSAPLRGAHFLSALRDVLEASARSLRALALHASADVSQVLQGVPLQQLAEVRVCCQHVEATELVQLLQTVADLSPMEPTCGVTRLELRMFASVPNVLSENKILNSRLFAAVTHLSVKGLTSTPPPSDVHSMCTRGLRFMSQFKALRALHFVGLVVGLDPSQVLLDLPPLADLRVVLPGSAGCYPAAYPANLVHSALTAGAASSSATFEWSAVLGKSPLSKLSALPARVESLCTGVDAAAAADGALNAAISPHASSLSTLDIGFAMPSRSGTSTPELPAGLWREIRSTVLGTSALSVLRLRLMHAPGSGATVPLGAAENTDAPVRAVMAILSHLGEYAREVMIDIPCLPPKMHVASSYAEVYLEAARSCPNLEVLCIRLRAKGTEEETNIEIEKLGAARRALRSRAKGLLVLSGGGEDVMCDLDGSDMEDTSIEREAIVRVGGSPPMRKVKFKSSAVIISSIAILILVVVAIVIALVVQIAKTRESAKKSPAGTSRQ